MSLRTISAETAKAMVDQGAVLVDVRGRDEHARERIAGARNTPVDALHPIESGGRPVVFHCKSGARTAAHAGRLAEAAQCEAYIVEGGIEAWKRAGLPVVADRSQPLEIQRQVFLIAGALVLGGSVLAYAVAPGFNAVAAFVGAGLMFAGATGWCGMAKLLAYMPWNKNASDVR